MIDFNKNNVSWRFLILILFPYWNVSRREVLPWYFVWRARCWFSAIRAKAGHCIRACAESWQLCKDKGILMSAHNSVLGRARTMKWSRGEWERQPYITTAGVHKYGHTLHTRGHVCSQIYIRNYSKWFWCNFALMVYDESRQFISLNKLASNPNQDTDPL
jgi:hypothetical protein